MKRKEFLQKGIAGAMIGSTAWVSASGENAQETQDKKVPWGYDMEYGEVRIERPVKGKPHKGKVLLAVQPHSDDIPLAAGGLIAKLMDEGYTGYLCTTSDNSRGAGTFASNRQDDKNIADFYGMKESFEFQMPHHQMDSVGIQDLKQRFIFLIRFLKVDTIVCMDPWGHYEENPDHYVTGRAVEAARWIAGNQDYPEHFTAGFGPYTPKERYYYSRAKQTNNLIVDISDYIDKKIQVNMLNLSKGPAGNNGVLLKERLAKEGKKLALLEGDDNKANFNYAKEFLFKHEKKLGEKYGLGWAEGFHYMSDVPFDNFTQKGTVPIRPEIEDYIKKNAVPL